MTRRERPNPVTLGDIEARMARILQARGQVSDDDAVYALQRLDKLKDERLRSIFVKTLGWSLEEHAELEHFVAIALRVMNKTNPSRLREAAQAVEIRYLMERQT